MKNNVSFTQWPNITINSFGCYTQVFFITTTAVYNDHRNFVPQVVVIDRFDCTLISCFCWKYIKFQLKRYRGVMSHYTKDWCKIWRKTNFLFQKWQEFGEFWSEHLKVWKICTLIDPFCAKYITFDLKRYRGIIFHDTGVSCKIWRKTDLCFQKWHEEFGKFSSEHLKVSKLVLSWDSFVPSRKCMN